MDRNNSAFPTNQSMSTDYAYVTGGLTKYEYAVIHISAALVASGLTNADALEKAKELADKISEMT